MVFIGVMILGIGVILLYCGIRNLAPLCVVSNTFTKGTANCTIS